MFDCNPEKGLIRMYGVIGSWDGEIDETMLIEALDKCDGKDVLIQLKSPGGEIGVGLSMYNQIEAYGGKVTVEVDAQAASIATVFPMAADKIQMRRRSEMFIHDPWTIAMGNSSEFRHVADYLDALAGEIAEVYAERAGGKKEEWMETMRETKRYSAAEAVAAGLADEVIGLPKSGTDPEMNLARAQDLAPPIARLKLVAMTDSLDKRIRISKSQGD